MASKECLALFLIICITVQSINCFARIGKRSFNSLFKEYDEHEDESKLNRGALRSQIIEELKIARILRELDNLLNQVLLNIGF